MHKALILPPYLGVNTWILKTLCNATVSWNFSTGFFFLFLFFSWFFGKKISFWRNKYMDIFVAVSCLFVLVYIFFCLVVVFVCLFGCFSCTLSKPKKIKENPRLMTVFCFEPLVWNTFWTIVLNWYELDGFLHNFMGPDILVLLFTISGFIGIKVSISSQGKIYQWTGDRLIFLFYNVSHRMELVLWIITNASDYASVERANRKGFLMVKYTLQSSKFRIESGTDCELLYLLLYSWVLGLCDLLC